MSRQLSYAALGNAANLALAQESCMAAARSIFSSILPLIAGALAGAMATVLISRDKTTNMNTPSSTAPHVSHEPGTIRIPTGANQGTGTSELDDLKKRLAALEKREAPSDTDQESPYQPAALPDPEEWKAHREKHHREIVEAHERAPVDSQWAPRARTLLLDELRTMETSDGFSVRNVDCRTNTCTALLEWADYGQAVKGWGSAIEHVYKLNCGREILLPEPPDPGVRYQATMVFTCDAPAE
ncbi:hypothetical protein [Polyangium sp. 15x6]|uniref:hypothetical protein n=1 Tax=Polyangium sp. 15x6 TaxID=3042687 RepID=UPI002499B89A|nr:hypothetical protein [Polyangium sp. 15x6]MDI3290312.1 hypothetical protein [Polyangium sp. 15x6]